MRIGAALPLVAALTVALLAPAGARAASQIVWQKEGEIWTMDVDGSNQRPLVRLADAPGMDYLGDPSLGPSGSTLLFTGHTEKHKVTLFQTCGSYPYTYSCNKYYKGYNATGLYRWRAGAVERLSPEPAPCSNCSSFHVAPSVRNDDSFLFHFFQCGGQSVDCASGLVNRPTAAAYGSHCGQSDISVAFAADPTSREVAYDSCDGDGANENVIWVSGPSGAGERVVSCDDKSQGALAYAPLGDRIVVVEGGEEPGLWSYDPKSNACGAETSSASYQLVSAAEHDFSEPAYYVDATGKLGILFTYQGDIWAIPESCERCAFPAGATRLTTGGKNNSAVWSEDGLTAGSRTDDPTPAPGGTTLGDPIRSVARIGRGAVRSRKGFSLKIAFRRATKFAVRIRKLPSRKSLGTETSAAPRAGAFEVAIKKFRGRYLAPGRYLVEVYAVSGRTKFKIRSVTVKVIR